MNFIELKKFLSSKSEFKNINSWKFVMLPHGGVSPHTYKVSKLLKVFFVKETTDAESGILETLVKLRTKIIPEVRYPSLLRKNVLVATFVKGGHARSKNIDSQLIKGYTILQNELNKAKYRKRLNKYNGCTSSVKDDGFFRSWITTDFKAEKDLIYLHKRYKLSITKKYLELLAHLREQRNEITNDYVSMPFAILHNDLKEDNIIGKPQKLVDWGSFYAYGPFLKDLAPFLSYSKKNFALFLKNSNICKNFSKTKIERWLFVALAARFLSHCKWRLKFGKNFRNKKECQKFLEYEYKTYSRLLKLPNENFCIS